MALKAFCFPAPNYQVPTCLVALSSEAAIDVNLTGIRRIGIPPDSVQDAHLFVHDLELAPDIRASEVPLEGATGRLSGVPLGRPDEPLDVILGDATLVGAIFGVWLDEEDEAEEAENDAHGAANRDIEKFHDEKRKQRPSSSRCMWEFPRLLPVNPLGEPEPHERF